MSGLSSHAQPRGFDGRGVKGWHIRKRMQGRNPMKPDPTNTPEAASRSPALAQAVAAPLTRAAIFLVATLNPGAENLAVLRSLCGDLAALVRAVEFRDLEGGLSCVMGFGAGAWDRLFGAPRPAELHPFREIRAGD